MLKSWIKVHLVLAIFRLDVRGWVTLLSSNVESHDITCCSYRVLCQSIARISLVFDTRSVTCLHTSRYAWAFFAIFFSVQINGTEDTACLTTLAPLFPLFVNCCCSYVWIFYSWPGWGTDRSVKYSNLSGRSIREDEAMNVADDECVNWITSLRDLW